MSIKIITTERSIITTNADKTVTISDGRRHVLTGLTAERYFYLPSVGVIAGDTWLIENQSDSFDIYIVAPVVAAGIIKTNGAEIDAQIRRGFVIVRAKVAAPTTVDDWEVVEVQERMSYTADFDGGAGASGSNNSKVILFRRIANQVTMTSAGNFLITTGPGSDGFIRTTTAIPNRFRSPTDIMIPTSVVNAGSNSTTVGLIYLGADGQIRLSRTADNGATAWASSSAATGCYCPSICYNTAIG